VNENTEDHKRSSAAAQGRRLAQGAARQSSAFWIWLAPILQAVGEAVLRFCTAIGRITVFALRGLFHTAVPTWYLRLTWKQIVEIGYYSLPVVGLTAIFTGMVLALQSYTGFARFSAESSIPNVVVVSITRELGPVLAGLMVAGRVGAAIAAEIGTMRVTEQIDALTTLSTNPFKYLVAPRLLAGVITLPLLVVIADIIGVFGGYVVSIYKLGFNDAAYIRNTIDFVEPMDVISGLVKAAAFGFIIALMGCYHGFYSKGGAQGVGKATTNAVVSASIMILTANYIITELFFSS
jgi:phospholipid/cholesterol/gamma-HCH transport system permease protein